MIWPVASVTMVDAGKSRSSLACVRSSSSDRLDSRRLPPRTPAISPEAPVIGIVMTMIGSPDTRDINAFEISGRFAAIVFLK